MNLQDALSVFPHGAAFVYHDGFVPEEYLHHKGKLWECRVCGLSYAAKRSFKKLNMDKLELIRLNVGNQYSKLYSSLFRYFIQSNVFPYLSARCR